MLRAEYERTEARGRGHTVPEMRRMGFWSAMDPASAVGWQTFAIPPESDRREHAKVLRQFQRPDNLHPQRFGEVGP